MKKLILTIAVLVLGIVAAAQVPGGGGVAIPPGGNGGTSGGKSKAPANYPLTVIAYDSSTFILENHVSLGTETIEIISPSGEEYSETLDSNLQSTLIIPVSPESGLWAVTVTTETAGTFYGYCQM